MSPKLLWIAFFLAPSAGAQSGQIDMPSTAPPTLSLPRPPPPPASIPPPSQRLPTTSGNLGVSIKVCNDSSNDALVAIGYKKSSEWIAEGWWRVDSKTCVGPFIDSLYGAIYGYAKVRGGNVVWRGSGGDAAFCIDTVDSFTNPDSRCGSNAHKDYEMKTFGKLNISPATSQFTWTLGN